MQAVWVIGVLRSPHDKSMIAICFCIYVGVMIVEREACVQNYYQTLHRIYTLKLNATGSVIPHNWCNFTAKRNGKTFLDTNSHAVSQVTLLKKINHPLKFHAVFNVPLDSLYLQAVSVYQSFSRRKQAQCYFFMSLKK